MKLLSGLDASFLHLETVEMPMHIGGLNLFDLRPGGDGDFYEEMKAHIVGRMHLSSVFTKKLALMPRERCAVPPCFLARQIRRLELLDHPYA